MRRRRNCAWRCALNTTMSMNVLPRCSKASTIWSECKCSGACALSSVNDGGWMSKNPIFEFTGLDHVALTCSDMNRTVDFYHGKLGMPVLHTIEYFDEAGEILGQHWFFGVGDPTNPDAHIAFFWWKDGYQALGKEEISTGRKPANRFARPVGGM